MAECEVLRKSKNGIEVYSYKNPALHSFYISLFVKSGCMYEDGEASGITHFLEHALIRNVNKLYDMKLYALLDKKGLEFNAGTYSEMVQFYVSGASSNFGVGAEIISKLFSPIVLTRAELDSERKRIKAEIRESDDKTSLATFTNKIVFEKTALASSIVGTNKTVDKVTLKSLEAYRRSAMSDGNIFLYVTGNFTDLDIDKLIFELEICNLMHKSGNGNIAPIPEKFGKRQTEVYIKNSDYTMMRFTFDLDMTKYSVAETDLLYDMLLSGYNSKLFIEMSEKRGLFYDISGSCERYKNIGTMYFSFEVKEKDVYDAARIVVEILNSVKEESGAESEFIKAGYVDNAYMLYDDARELNFTFAYDNHIMNETYASVEDRRCRYDKIDAKRLASMAKEIFTPENLTVTMKSNKKHIDTEKIKKIVGNLI